MTPHEHLLAYADLEHAELLIDAPSLSTLLNREVELIHRRIKPGHSVLVAWRCRSSGECGWAEVTSSPDKVANTLRRAARYGLEVTVHREGVLSGLVWSDRKLVRALDGLPRTGLRILRYNPHRRLVAATSDGLVVRVHADDASHLGRTAARWQSAGVRTLSAVGGGQVSVSPWWGHGDLGAVPSAAAARSAGEEVARLHRLSMPPGPVRSPEIDTTAATLAPWTAEAVHSLAARLAVLLPATEGETCALHGDLSPDQILVGEDGQIRLIDLDRATTGPAARDVGSFLAACDPDLAGDFLAGYRAAGGRVDQAHVAAWEALAHLNYGLAPLRGGAEDWVAPLERSLAAAHRALDLLPPATVEVDGRAWAVTRAWPGQELSVELRDPDSGAIRAGRWTRHEVVAEAPGTDPRLDLPAGEVVSHRRGKRAVVRSSDGQRYTKVVRAGKATGILAGIDRARPFTAGFRMPEVLAADDRSVTFAALPGRSLHQPSLFTEREWSTAWQEVADALARVQAAPAADSSVTHTAAVECAVLEEWCARAVFHVADPAALQAVVARACADLLSLPPGDLVPTHRDLHDKQLLWERNAGPGLLDVDTACLADPALDVANLRAHSVWRFRQGVWDDRQAAVVLGVLESNAAVKAYERATLVRLVCVYAVRPRYREAARALLAELA